MRQDAAIAMREGSHCVAHLILIEDWEDVMDMNSGEITDSIVANRSYEIRATRYTGEKLVERMIGETTEEEAIAALDRFFLKIEGSSPIPDLSEEEADHLFGIAPVVDPYANLPRYGRF